ncbi:MAG TPA: hypothetical protein VH559_06365 [Gemmatimonadaceae bacterium]
MVRPQRALVGVRGGVLTGHTGHERIDHHNRAVAGDQVTAIDAVAEKLRIGV